MFSAGTIEYSRLILLTQKLQSGSFILADLTARDKTLSEEQLDNIFLAIDNIIQPFEFDAERHGRSSPASASTPRRRAGGQLAARRSRARSPPTSEIGSEGDDGRRCPADLDIAAGETIIAAEVFYSFEPLFGIGLGAAGHPPGRLLQAAPRRRSTTLLP